MPRVTSLFDPATTGVTLRSADPLLPAADVGAEAAEGYVSDEPEVRVSVYRIKQPEARDAALKRLEEAVPGEDKLVETAVNGDLVFIGYADKTGDPDGDDFHPLVTLVTAFAGEE